MTVPWIVEVGISMKGHTQSSLQERVREGVQSDGDMDGDVYAESQGCRLSGSWLGQLCSGVGVGRLALGASGDWEGKRL